MKVRKGRFFTVLLLLVITVAACVGGYLIYARFFKGVEDQDNFGQKMIGEFDIYDRVEQEKVFYSIPTTNSLQAECEWGEIDFGDLEIKEEQLPVYKYISTFKRLELPDELLGEELETFASVEDAADDFYSRYSLGKEEIYYEYLPEIFSDDVVSYEKTPVFQDVNGLKILVSNIAAWRDDEGEYVVGLYEVGDGYSEVSFHKDDAYFGFEPLGKSAIEEVVKESKLKFLNHEFLCEDGRISKTELDSEVVYVPIGDYLVPQLKVVGEFVIGGEVVKWTALVNVVDYAKLDKTIYVDATVDEPIVFSPRPHVTSVVLREGKYYVEGVMGTRVRVKADAGLLGESVKDDFELESSSIDFLTTEETGEYVYGGRKSALEDEIKSSLEVEGENSKFSFNFSADNYWKVEEVERKEDAQGEILSATHSADKEMFRYTYDNKFRIATCSVFSGLNEYLDSNKICSQESIMFEMEIPRTIEAWWEENV